MADGILQILMIDDSHTQYAMVKDFLQIGTTLTSNYEVEWASTYEEGMQMLEVNSYVVCLVDYELGDRNGLELISEAVEKEISVPMILLTGHGDYNVDIQAMRAGAVDYLDKAEIKPKTLERTIRYARQNQEMLDHERQQRLVTEALLDTALAINSSLQFDEVMERILLNMKHVIPHDAANILLVDDDNVSMASHIYTDEQIRQTTELLKVKLSKITTLQKMKQTQKPILVNDVENNTDWVKVEGTQYIKSYLGVPIIIQDEVIGFLNFDGYGKNKFTEDHAHYAQIFAQQAAQAIRNTRAYEQAQALAATQERQRLARDLHDAVSQTLFSASVIAQTLPRLVDQNPDEVHDGLQELNRLNRGALAEMRTLLVELRSQSLVETDLPTLLRNLVHAHDSRSDATFESRINYTSQLPDDVHVAFYRIAQEALNNIQKYANASHVTMELVQNNGSLMLTVIDDGCGFDPQFVPSGHYGLKIMQERADAIDAQLTVTSALERGTNIQLIWQDKVLQNGNR